MRIQKVSQTTATQAQCVNHTTDSKVDTYSCDYINQIVESGSNENGSYIKYKNGILICYGEAKISSPITYSDWYGFCRLANDQTVAFPYEFIDNEYKITMNSYVFGYFSSIIRTKTTASFTFRPCTHNNSSYNPGEGSFDYIAIGRWK